MRGTKSHNALPLGLDDDSSDKLNTETEKSPPMSTQGSEQQLPDDYVATAKDNSSTTTTATANGGSGGGASSSSAASRPNSALKTKSLPKISAIFKKSSPTSSGAGSNNNAHHQIASSANALNVVNAKNRSISASPNTTGGGSGASSATVTTMAGSMATLSIATPLNQASKMACLSAYEMHTPLTQKSYTLDDFMVVKRVGKGGFASVYLTRLKASTGRYWALKVVKKADVVRLKQEKQILNEKNILKGIQHAFIVELVQTFQDPQHLYMVLEYVAGGDLFTYLRKVQV